MNLLASVPFTPLNSQAHIPCFDIYKKKSLINNQAGRFLITRMRSAAGALVRMLRSYLFHDEEKQAA